jgi:hypothetical protein
MAVQVKNLNLALPDSLTAKDFMDGHGVAVDGPAIVKLHNGGLQAENIGGGAHII